MKSDQHLLAEIKLDLASSFEALFNRYWHKLYLSANYRVKNPSLAEDLVQDVFTTIWERRHRLDIEGSLEGYLQTALKYRIINWLSRADLQQAALKHLLDRMDEMEATILDRMAAEEIGHTLEEALTQFPENMRRVFSLRAENYTISEIAKALGLAEQTVKNNSSEALARLKTILKEKHPDVYQSFFAALLLLMKN